MNHRELPRIESLKFESVSFAYEGHSPLFESLEFEFPMGQVVWVKASSGAGRSTLMQLLAGLQVPTKGTYRINDQDVGDMSFEEFLPFRLSIGYGFDFGGVIHNRTLYENLMLPLLYHKLIPINEAEERVTQYMDRLGILRYKDQRPSLVQGAVRKIVCLLRPLLLHPQVLLLDDPSLGLGQDVILKYFDLIQDVRKNGVLSHIFICSFDEKLMNLVDHTEILLQEGQLHSLEGQDMKKVVHL